MTTLETASPEQGLTPAEVRQRMEAGLVNRLSERPTRTTGEIVRANVVTRFNILLSVLLIVVLVVLREPRDALFGIVLDRKSVV